MIISVASLTLRFYKHNGWSEQKVRDLLVNPKMKITLRKSELLGECLDYYAVYEKSGYEVFKASEIKKHYFEDKRHLGDINWYIREGV